MLLKYILVPASILALLIFLQECHAYQKQRTQRRSNYRRSYSNNSRRRNKNNYRRKAQPVRYRNNNQNSRSNFYNIDDQSRYQSRYYNRYNLNQRYQPPLLRTNEYNNQITELDENFNEVKSNSKHAFTNPRGDHRIKKRANNQKLTVNQFLRNYRLPDNTGYSLEELKIILQDFVLNAENSVSFSKQQLQEAYEAFYPEGDGREYCQYLFNALDTNKNQDINFNEYAQGLSIVHRGKFVERARLGFKVYDANSDGYITEKEMLKVVQAYHKFVGEETSDIFSKTEATFGHMDADLDGILMEQEFIKGCTDDSSIITGISLFDGFKIGGPNKRKLGGSIYGQGGGSLKTKVGS